MRDARCAGTYPAGTPIAKITDQPPLTVKEPTMKSCTVQWNW
jgi:hypothetical protein